MEMVRFFNENGSQNCLTWKRQKNGQYTVTNDFYDGEGYYISHKSRTLPNIEMAELLSQIDAAEGICPKIVKY